MRIFVRIITALLSVVVLSISGVLAYGQAALISNVQTVDLPHTQMQAKTTVDSFSSAFDSVDKPINILLLGSDSRQGANSHGYGSPDDIGGARSDTTMLVHLPAGRQWAQIVSIPRDLIVNIPASSKACGGSYQDTTTRFNEAFSLGGPTCTVATVEKLTGLNIDHVAAVDFSGFIRTVDAIGGLKVCLSSTINDPNAKLHLNPGTHNLNGIQALGLARVRETIGDGSDIGRTSRQQYIMRLLLTQLKNMGVVTDPVLAWKLANIATESLTTDAALANPSALLAAASQIGSLDQSRLYTSTLPWLPDPNDPNNTVVVDSGQAAKLWKAMATDTEPVVKAVPTSTKPNPSPSSSAPDPAAQGEAGVFCKLP